LTGDLSPSGIFHRVSTLDEKSQFRGRVWFHKSASAG